MTQAGTVNAMWRRVLAVHPDGRRLGSRGAIPKSWGPGCLYLRSDETKAIYAVLARDPQAAWARLAEEIDPSRTAAFYAPGSHHNVLEDSPLLSRVTGSALRPGRPRLIRSWEQLAAAPVCGGIYRIHRYDRRGEHRWYVGEAINLRRRLSRGHPHVSPFDGWGVESGYIECIELISVRPPTGPSVWTTDQLDAAERRHYQRMVDDWGADRSLNRIAPGSGRPGGLPAHLYVWEPAKPDAVRI